MFYILGAWVGMVSVAVEYVYIPRAIFWPRMDKMFEAEWEVGKIDILRHKLKWEIREYGYGVVPSLCILVETDTISLSNFGTRLEAKWGYSHFLPHWLI